MINFLRKLKSKQRRVPGRVFATSTKEWEKEQRKFNHPVIHHPRKQKNFTNI